MKENNKVSVAVCCSEKYASYFSVMFLSLLDHFDPKRELDIYILTEDLSRKSRVKIETLKKYHDFSIQYLYLKDKDFSFLDSSIRSPVHVSRIASARILLPKLLPNVDKILTLEVDQLINEDISKLYDVDLEDYSMAAVQDCAEVRHSLRLWNEKSEYFNGGVCLLNLKKLREKDYLTLFKKRIKTNGHKYLLQEQDIWNDGLRFDIKRLNIRWNLYHCFYSKDLLITLQFVPKDKQEYKEACENPAIYHFVSEDKVWFPTVKKPYTDKYREYEKKSPFYKRLKYYSYDIVNKHFSVLTWKGKIIYRRTEDKNNKNSCLENLLSFKNSTDKQFKVVTIFGKKFKFRKKEDLLPSLRGIVRAETSEAALEESQRALAIQKLHSSTFAGYKFKHTKQEMAVVGCGPSLLYYQGNKKRVHVALNKAILVEKIKFDYFFAWDYLGFLANDPAFFDKIKKYPCKKFYGKFLNPRLPQIPDFPEDQEYNISHFYSSARHMLPAYHVGEIIYPDIEVYPLADFMSISFAAIQFGLYTQPQKIFLVGLDTAQNGHYVGDDSTYNLGKMKWGYAQLKSFAQIHYPKVEIISINPVGLKGMFKDVYTQAYVDAHPELLEEDIEILKD